MVSKPTRVAVEKGRKGVRLFRFEKIKARLFSANSKSIIEILSLSASILIPLPEMGGATMFS